MHHSHWVSKAKPGCSLEGLRGVQTGRYSIPSVLHGTHDAWGHSGELRPCRDPSDTPHPLAPRAVGALQVQVGQDMLSCLPAGCARGAFAASSPKCPQVCTNPEQPHGALFSSAPTAPTFGFPCPGSACPAQASPSPSALLSALQAGFHFRAVLCVSPAGGDRQTGWVTGQSRAVQSNFQAGWAWGTLLMGSCRTEAFPAFTTQFRLVKKIISFLASVCQGEIKNLPRLVPGLRACPALTPLRMALLTLFGFRLLLWHLLTRVSWRFPCMELCGVAVGQEGEKGWVGAPCVPFPTSPIHLEAQQGPAEPRFPALK